MNKFEFLYSDDKKYIPVHLQKMNYGYAPLNGLREPEQENIQKSINITFPGFSTYWNTALGGMVVLLIKKFANGASNIETVKVFPKGEHSATFELTNYDLDSEYTLYAISENFNDGFFQFINDRWKIAELDSNIIATPLNNALNVANEIEINIVDGQEGGLVKSVPEGSGEWYNWQGVYTSPDLIWFNPEDTIYGGLYNDLSNTGYHVYGLDAVYHIAGFFHAGSSPAPAPFLSNEGDNLSDFKVLSDAAGSTQLPITPIYMGINETVGYEYLTFDENEATDGMIFAYVYTEVNRPIGAVPVYEFAFGAGGQSGWATGRMYTTNIDASEHSLLNDGAPLFYALPIDFEETMPPEGWQPDQNIPYGGAGTGLIQNTAQLAILQNIRFLKTLLESTNENLWNTVNTTIALMNEKMTEVVDVINDFDDTNSMMSTISARVTDTQLEIKIAEYLTSNNLLWSDFSNFNTSFEVGMVSLDMSTYDNPGKYVLSIRPKQYYGTIDNITKDLIHIPSDGLNNIMESSMQLRNYFYGWNIEFFHTNGTPYNMVKKIVGSYHLSDGQTFKISPLFDGELDLNETDLTVKIWSDVFESQLIEVDIVEHNAETLSYSLYGKRSMDRTSGVMKIYDHNGNVYKTFSMGTLSNNITGGNIVDYRCNVEDEICFTDEDI